MNETSRSLFDSLKSTEFHTIIVKIVFNYPSIVASTDTVMCLVFLRIFFVLFPCSQFVRYNFSQTHNIFLIKYGFFVIAIVHYILCQCRNEILLSISVKRRERKKKKHKHLFISFSIKSEKVRSLFQ